MAQIEIDFVGMFVVVEEPAGMLSICCLDEPGHVHTMHFWDSSDQIQIEALRSFGGRRVSLSAATRASTTIIEPGRLRDVATDGGGSLSNVDGLMTVTAGRARPPVFFCLDLSGGTLTTLPALIGDDASKWELTGSGQITLTDRLRYAATVPDPVQWDVAGATPIELTPDSSGKIRVVCSAIDADFGERPVDLRDRFPLTEYALFYQLTREYGPIPVSASSARGGNPKRPICPAGYLKV